MYQRTTVQLQLQLQLRCCVLCVVCVFLVHVAIPCVPSSACVCCLLTANNLHLRLRKQHSTAQHSQAKHSTAQQTVGRVRLDLCLWRRLCGSGSSSLCRSIKPARIVKVELDGALCRDAAGRRLFDVLDADRVYSVPLVRFRVALSKKGVAFGMRWRHQQGAHVSRERTSAGYLRGGGGG